MTNTTRIKRNEEDIQRLYDFIEELQKDLAEKGKEISREKARISTLNNEVFNEVKPSICKLSDRLSLHPQDCPALQRFLQKAMTVDSHPPAPRKTSSNFPLLALLEKLPIPRKVLYTGIGLGIAAATTLAILLKLGLVGGG